MRKATKLWCSVGFFPDQLPTSRPVPPWTYALMTVSIAVCKGPWPLSLLIIFVSPTTTTSSLHIAGNRAPHASPLPFQPTPLGLAHHPTRLSPTRVLSFPPPPRLASSPLLEEEPLAFSFFWLAGCGLSLALALLLLLQEAAVLELLRKPPKSWLVPQQEKASLRFALPCLAGLGVKSVLVLRAAWCKAAALNAASLLLASRPTQRTRDREPWGEFGSLCKTTGKSWWP